MKSRYLLLGSLGQGGMGQVFLAHDRLTGDHVAYKRLLPAYNNSWTGQEFRLALAREFEILASVRHPNIICVRDYGVSGETPYYTMDYPPEAVDILGAGRGLDLAGKVGLLLQALQALAYLHRRGVLHRDLKPENMMVAGGRLLLLDFGLAIWREQAGGRAGTLAYIAPEILEHSQAGEASDLYALGVIACQLFSGRLPFSLSDPGGLNTRHPDPAALPDDPGLARVVSRLLAHRPNDRYASAVETARALRTAINLPGQRESVAMRDSYLQTARFTGRQPELAVLFSALAQGGQGHGSAWLIGGESGAGKTRLLEEMRIQGMVRGARVLTARPTSPGGAPYRLWSELLRPLTLFLDLDDRQARVLLPLVEDLPALLERPVPPAPKLSPAEARHRLSATVADVVCAAARQFMMGERPRQPEQVDAQPTDTGQSFEAFIAGKTVADVGLPTGQPAAAKAEGPLLLLLDDLQWARDELETLQWLARRAADLPLVIVGAYRDDERPELPDQLATFRPLNLPRLDAPEIAELSAAMLGQAGQRADLLALLERETSGNAFFLVEIIRLLADEVGGLDFLDQARLPTERLAGSVQRLLYRRLERLAQKDLHLLRLAAADGPDLDLAVLEHLATQGLADSPGLDDWLERGAAFAVLEPQAGGWRFAHERLRLALLDGQPSEELARLHRHLAQALETLYPSRPQKAAALAAHWLAAGDTQLAGRYAAQAAEYAVSRMAYDEALEHYARAVELAAPGDLRQRFNLHLARLRLIDPLGLAAGPDLDSLQELADQIDHPPARAEAVLQRAVWELHAGRAADAWSAAQQALQITRSLPAGIQQAGLSDWPAPDSALATRSYLISGQALARQGAVGAWEQLELALTCARQEGSALQQAAVLTAMGDLARERGEAARAQARLEQAMALYQQAGYRQGMAEAAAGLGGVYHDAGIYTAALGYYRQSLDLCGLIGALRLESSALAGLGRTECTLGSPAAARQVFVQALALARQAEDRPMEAVALHGLGLADVAAGLLEQALVSLDAALHLRRNLGDQAGQSRTLLGRALAAHGQGRPRQAIADSLEALALTRTDSPPAALQAEIQAFLGLLALEAGRLPDAEGYIAGVLAFLDSEGSFGAAEQPLHPYLACIQVLQAAGSPRARALLSTAYSLLQSRAARLDEATRSVFLGSVTYHRQLIILFRREFS